MPICRFPPVSAEAAPVTMPPPLSIRELARATVMPYRRGEKRGTWEMGVFDEKGACVEETLTRHPRLDGKQIEVGSPAAFRPASREDAGTAIYLGPLLEHFGHFLLESLARLWFARAHPEQPVVWSCRVEPGAPAQTQNPLKAWQRDMLEILELRNPAIFVDAPVRFERLIIPELGYRFRSAFHPEHVEALAAVPHRPEPGRRLWLSRRKLKRLQNRSMTDVEARLADLGWTILYPETLPFPQQVAELAAAERVAGEQGSAFHSLVFLRDPEKLRVDIFLEDPNRRRTARNTNYEIIAKAKGFDQRMHLMKSEVIVKQGKGFRVEKYSTDTQEYFDKLDIGRKEGRRRKAQVRRKPAAAHGRRSESVMRINRTAELTQALRYLEIGVATGRTFLNVNVMEKHGVDPKFRFGTADFANEQVRFFEMTSDRYFTDVATRLDIFDIIFLDGLHTFEQTFRDFCASQAHAHADTVWILDDVFPNDVFSALPSQQRALAFRKQHGLKSRDWHGDVFKCVFAINDFFPSFSFRTVERGYGNPQTFLVQRPRTNFAPLFGDLERITRLDYWDFCKHRELLRLEPEESVFNWLADMLQQRNRKD